MNVPGGVPGRGGHQWSALQVGPGQAGCWLSASAFLLVLSLSISLSLSSPSLSLLSLSLFVSYPGNQHVVIKWRPSPWKRHTPAGSGLRCSADSGPLLAGAKLPHPSIQPKQIYSGPERARLGVAGPVSEASKGLLCSSSGSGGNAHPLSARPSPLPCPGPPHPLGCRALTNSPSSPM